MRTLVIATRELHGVVMDLEHLVLAWCVRFVGLIISRTVKGADGLTAFPRAFQGASHEEFVVGTLAGCVEFRTVKRRPREDAADLVFFNSIRGTPGRLVPDDEPREPREPREQPLRIDVPPVHADLPPPTSTEPTSTEPTMPRRVYIRKSVELARYPGCIGCEAAMTQ